MLTESQRRALRAKQLLDSGRDAREVARELGYTKVSGMLGAISMCEARLKRSEKAFADIAQQNPEKETPKELTTAKVYPMENGVITIRKGDVSVSWKPRAGTAFINVHNYAQAKWLPLYGDVFGGKKGLADALRQIAEAATEAASLLEEGE